MADDKEVTDFATLPIRLVLASLLIELGKRGTLSKSESIVMIQSCIGRIPKTANEKIGRKFLEDLANELTKIPF